MKTPSDKKIAFYFVSQEVSPVEDRWSARVHFPPGAGAETVLPIEVMDGNEEPVADAVLEIFGQRLNVSAGAASTTYADFIAGVHSMPVWMHRKGKKPVPGGLTFG